jgi:hypothetical protein
MKDVSGVVYSDAVGDDETEMISGEELLFDDI